MNPPRSEESPRPADAWSFASLTRLLGITEAYIASACGLQNWLCSLANKRAKAEALRRP